MKKSGTMLLVLLVVFGLKTRCEAASSLERVQTIRMPGITGSLDHLGVDLKGRRLFVTAEGNKSVEVLDLQTNKPIHSIGGIGGPHAVLYRGDLNQIYVTDGSDGSVKIFKGDTYDLVKTVKIALGTNTIGYDPATHLLYLSISGKASHSDHSMVSILDTTSGEHVGDIEVEGDMISSMLLEKSGPRIFLSNRAKNRVEVIDREKRAVLASWPLGGGKTPAVIAIDEDNHRLFVTCRSEHIVVFDTKTAKELESLPIGPGVDDAFYDPGTKRVYAVSDGSLDVYRQVDPDHYEWLGRTPTGPGAATAIMVPELNRYFIAAPQHENTDAQILVYKVE
jgi:DNA-binding beta-propeller fold protein YncE